MTSAQREHSEEPGPDRRAPTSGPGKDGGDDAGRRDRDVERQGAVQRRRCTARLPGRRDDAANWQGRQGVRRVTGPVLR